MNELSPRNDITPVRQDPDDSERKDLLQKQSYGDQFASLAKQTIEKIISKNPNSIVVLEDGELAMRDDNIDPKFGENPRFKLISLVRACQLLQEYLKKWDNHEYDKEKDFVKLVMSNFRSLAITIPNQIPDYFDHYPPATTNEGEKMYYYPDGSVEAYQDETEPYIRFALELSQQGKEVPSTWQELTTQYAESHADPLTIDSQFSD